MEGDGIGKETMGWGIRGPFCSFSIFISMNFMNFFETSSNFMRSVGSTCKNCCTNSSVVESVVDWGSH